MSKFSLPGICIFFPELCKRSHLNHWWVCINHWEMLREQITRPSFLKTTSELPNHYFNDFAFALTGLIQPSVTAATVHYVLLVSMIDPLQRSHTLLLWYWKRTSKNSNHNLRVLADRQSGLSLCSLWACRTKGRYQQQNKGILWSVES